MDIQKIISNSDCCILAGGKSSRMNGFPKGLLDYGGESAVQLIRRNLACFDRIFLSANDERYFGIGMESYADEYKDIGPISGLYTALAKSRKKYVFVTCCDMPFLSSRIVECIADNTEGEAAALSDGEHIFPLIGFYSCDVCEKLLKQIKDGDYRPHAFLKSLNYRIVTVPEELKEEIRNINTAEEYQSVKNSIESKVKK